MREPALKLFQRFKQLSSMPIPLGAKLIRADRSDASLSEHGGLGARMNGTADFHAQTLRIVRSNSHGVRCLTPAVRNHIDA